MFSTPLHKTDDFQTLDLSMLVKSGFAGFPIAVLLFRVDLLNSTIGYFNCWSYLAIISKRILEDFSSLATSKCEEIKANPKHGQHPLQHRSLSEN
jgi:hypothetical protein